MPEWVPKELPDVGAARARRLRVDGGADGPAIDP